MRRTGVILVELIMAVAIFAIIFFTVVLIFRTGIKQNIAVTQLTTIISNTRKALYGAGRIKGIVPEIRSACGVTDLNSSMLSLIVGQTTVYFYLNGEDIIRDEAGSKEAVASHCSKIQFVYYQRQPDYTIALATEPENVHLISALVQIKQGNREMSLSANSQLRNK